MEEAPTGSASLGTGADRGPDLSTPSSERKTSRRVGWLRRHRIEQGNVCHYCGCPFAESADDRLLIATLDHVIPRSAGGEHSFENTVAACWLCNTAKQSMLPDEVAIHLPHRRIALLNGIEWKPTAIKIAMKRARKRASARIRAKLKSEIEA